MKVYKAINEVQAELAKSGITKDGVNTQGQGYKFRGIDAVYNALSPALAKYGLVVVPRVISREQVERIAKSGGALFYTTLLVEFDFVSAEDGSKHTASAYGEAMDSGDKSTNKAMSAAFKYAMFQTFCIPTEAQDADSETHEVMDAHEAKQLALKVAHDEAFKRLKVSVDYMKEAIKKDDAYSVAEAWRELSHGDQNALWRAPTKGGCFTTHERDYIRNKLPKAETA